ncbi:MAG: hypothetical protein KJ930_14985 [Gammaproteobacteria bacterium]|nr:hypothetical protein [Gammaproteobacteria bacterium]
MKGNHMDNPASDNFLLADDRFALLAQLPPFTLIKRLLPALQKYRFGVGGSLLLCELGLLSQARDLDLVCVADDFQQVAAAIAVFLRPLKVSPHPLYHSRHFARFTAEDGTELDLMAGICVQATPQIEWQFDPSQLQWRHEVPWMTAQQWLELYQLFQRPERVAVLQLFLKQSESAT